MNKISQLQARQAKYNSTRMTDLNHWGTLMKLKPEVFHPADRKLFASKLGSGVDLSGGDILTSLFGFGGTDYVDSLEYSWEMESESYVPMTIMKVISLGEDPEKPGKGREDIIVEVDKNLGQIGESWMPGSSDKSQVVTIKSKRLVSSGQYEYTFRTYTEGHNHYIKPKYFKPGTQWTRFYTMRGEAAESGGHTERGNMLEFYNTVVKLRKQYKVTDYASQAVLEVAFKDEKGKTYRSWMDWQEVEYRRALNRELAYNAIYSRIGDEVMYDPDSGYPIEAPAGFQQQMEFGGNVEGYTTLSTERVEAFIEKIVYSRISPGDLGEVIGTSGWYGMKMWDAAIKRWVGENAVIAESDQFIGQDKKGVHDNSLVAGHQYTLYRLPNGGRFRMVYDPMKDDKRIHRDINPLTGKPLESGRITVFDVTGGNGSSLTKDQNIRIVKKNKVFANTIIYGRVGPGGVIPKYSSHSGDYYEVHLSDSISAKIIDPTLTGELVQRPN